jgi:hypothetical protein
MIAKIKEIIAAVKAAWKLFVAAVVVGFVAGALLIGPLAALIQYIKDVVK